MTKRTYIELSDVLILVVLGVIWHFVAGDPIKELPARLAFFMPGALIILWVFNRLIDKFDKE